MNTYNWVISGLHAKIQDGDLTNVIESVHYRYQATDADGNTTDLYGSVGLDAVDADEFVAHEDLTQEIVEGWLEAKLDVEQLQSSLDAQLERIANPTHRTLSLI